MIASEELLQTVANLILYITALNCMLVLVYVSFHFWFSQGYSIDSLHPGPMGKIRGCHVSGDLLLLGFGSARPSLGKSLGIAKSLKSL